MYLNARGQSISNCGHQNVIYMSLENMEIIEKNEGSTSIKVPFPGGRIVCPHHTEAIDMSLSILDFQLNTVPWELAFNSLIAI